MALLDRIANRDEQRTEERKAPANAPAAPPVIAAPPPPNRNRAVHPRYPEIKSSIQQQLLADLPSFNSPEERKKAKALITASVDITLDDMNLIMSRHDKNNLIEQLESDILGLGPLDELLTHPDITEIMVNGYDTIYVEMRGKLTKYPSRFDSNEHLRNIIDRIVSSIGRRVDESSPMVDARLADGSRVNVIIPPLALKGPTLTIRRFSKDPYTIDSLVEFGTLTAEMATFLRACVRGRRNIVVSGGTGSGKTTTLNVLSSWIPADERIITIEDSAELQLNQDHVVTLESRPANIEGRGNIGIRELVINSLRMRPDRIVVGEVRGGETLDMLQAMNTGHDGSLTTVHANNTHDALSRLETMVLMAGTDLPSRAIREQIAAAVQIITQQARLRDGSRRMIAISEVRGFDPDGRVKVADIFRFVQQGMDADGKVLGYFEPCGPPDCLDDLKAMGEPLDPRIFLPKPKENA